MKKFIHKLVHLINWQYVTIITKEDRYYLKCLYCGKESFYCAVGEFCKKIGF